MVQRAEPNPPPPISHERRVELLKWNRQDTQCAFCKDCCPDLPVTYVRATRPQSSKSMREFWQGLMGAL